MLNDAVTSRLDRISQKRRGKTDAVFASVFSNGCAGEFGTGGQQVGQADKTPKHSGGLGRESRCLGAYRKKNPILLDNSTLAVV